MDNRPTSTHPAHPGQPPPLPTGLERNLRSFRARIRRTKLTEQFAIAATALVVSFLAVAALDRFVDTHALARAALFFGALAAAVVVVPRALRRWFFRHHDLAQVAREVSIRDEAVGDRLLGVFELTRDEEEFRRSPGLVRAAIAQGDRDLGTRDLSHALPRSRHAAALGALAVPALAAAAVAITQPAVFQNALARWAMPFADVERYTFTRLADLDGDWVVPIQEERAVTLSLATETRRVPAEATLRVGRDTVRAARTPDGSYTVVVPPMSEEREALLVVGDVRETVRILPRERPEVTGAVASVQLPSYLGIAAPLVRDVRGGSLSLVEGANAAVTFEFSRALESAEIAAEGLDGAGERTPLALDAPRIDGSTLSLPTVAFGVDSPRAGGARLGVSWIDELGLEGHSAFDLAVRTRVDEPPVAVLTGLDREVVLLVTKGLTFEVMSSDDFGVRRVGLEWREIGARGRVSDDVAGSKVLQAGAPDDEALQSLATLKPEDDDIPPGFYELRGWASDAFPGRGPSYSPPVKVRVMSPEEHMEWVTTNLERWLERASEVRDREMELLAENKALHALANADLATPEARRRIEEQARSERSNRARLQSIVKQGEDLLSEAARNDEFGSNALDDWAEANAKLKKIADERMDSVANLLAEAARSQAGDAAEQPMDAKPGSPAQPAGSEMPSNATPSGVPSEPGDLASASGQSPPPPSDPSNAKKKEDPPMVGENRTPPSGSGAAPEDKEESPEDAIPDAPAIMDGESSLAANEPDAPKPGEDDEAAPPPPPPSLSLVETTLAPAKGAEPKDESTENPGPQAPEQERPSKTKEEIAAAIAEQEKLLAEFNEVAGELEQVLASLENSTFVKRLKAASRAQVASARDLDVSVESGFGSKVATTKDEIIEATAAVATRRDEELPKLSNLHGDLKAYLTRLESRSSGDVPKFKRVMEEWEDIRPTLLADLLVDEADGGRPGEARGSADFLGDTLDRWGEELVGPG